MDKKHLVTLSKEELLERMSRIMDEILEVTSDRKEGRLKELRDEVHQLRQLLNEIDKIKKQ